MAAAAMKHMVSNFSKLDKFEEVDFNKYGKKKMHFFAFQHKVQDMTSQEGTMYAGPSVVNMWEHNTSSQYNATRVKIKHHDNHKDDANTRRPKPTCWNVPENCHIKRDCKGVNVGNKANGSGTKGSVDGSSNSLKGQIIFNKSVQVYYVTYVSEAYLAGLLMSAWLNIVNDNIASAFMSTSKLNDSILWHARLGHVHFKRMQDMSKEGLIRAFDMDTKKCKTCMLTKITKKPFQNVKRKTEVLELIHSDLCDLHATPSLGNKKYFMTFIDDASRTESRVLGVWGCKAVVRLPDPKLKTLGERGIECIFVGYAEHSKAFRFYVTEPNDSVAINSIIKSRDAIFDENRLFLVPRPSLRIPNRIEDIGGLVVPEEVTEEMDVNTDFMNGELDEEVYMNQPQGFIMPDNENKVDLAKEFLSSRFSMKDMGEADAILGIRIKHESNGIAISQSYYIEKELKKFSYFDCTPDTLLNTSEKLMPNNGQAISQLEYSRVIGYLMYAMTCTRPDIAFAVGKLSKYTSNPGYTDASWINNSEENSSTSGWVFLLGGGAISWASKKQTCVAGSTMKSEFIALSAASKEAEWLRNLILEIPLWSKPVAPIFIRCDSAATLAKAYSQMYNGKSRHLGVRHSMIRELIMNMVISIKFVRSQQNLTGHLTKTTRDLVIKSSEGCDISQLSR
ncbi:zinc finger, CCHC-type containing protein [Tanacetum coccineum]|uniref:Zinc finger, CCHC-type containing protein n=1 Tax=Tanacetum coccineum TaxID=301880 RepID=A0ABQ5F9C4_9ASTR